MTAVVEEHELTADISDRSLVAAVVVENALTAEVEEE
jgi:hypothetical protein